VVNSPEDPVILNVQQTAFYRVNYDPRGWDLLTRSLLTDHTSIHRTNRAQLLEDALNLARAAVLDYPTALLLTGYLPAETDYVPWTAAISGLQYLENMFSSRPGFGQLRGFLLQTLQPLYSRLGWEGEEDTFLEEKLRTVMLDQAECREHSLQLVRDWMAAADPDAQSPIPASVRDTVLYSHGQQ